MIVFLIRLLLGIQILFLLILGKNTLLFSYALNLDLPVHYIMFYVILAVLAWFSFFPRHVEFLLSEIKKKRVYIFFLFLFGLPGFELMFRLVTPDLYPVYAHLIKNKRYLVDGNAALSQGIFARGDYFAFKSKKNLNVLIEDKRYGFEMRVKTNADGFRFLKNNNKKKI